MTNQVQERWDESDRYERYMGRWSRPMAAAFLEWLAMPPAKRWLDVGCGTGALSQAILDCCEPDHVLGVDPSEGFLEYARRQTSDGRVQFRVATADALPAADGDFDAVVSGLAFNFMPSPDAALAEMKRTAAPGGSVALYVWDYSGKMEPLRYFWDAAVALNPNATSNEQGHRFPICKPDALHDCFMRVGFSQITVEPLDVGIRFADMDAYWQPFAEGGPFPAPAYLATRPQSEREEVRALLAQRLPLQEDGSFTLTLRAWAAQGVLHST